MSALAVCGALLGVVVLLSAAANPPVVSIEVVVLPSGEPRAVIEGKSYTATELSAVLREQREKLGRDMVAAFVAEPHIQYSAIESMLVAAARASP